MFNIRKFFEEHKKSIGWKMLFCLCVYSILLVYNLANNLDGLWDGPTHVVDDWDLSIGRWMLQFLNFIQYRVSMNPFTSIIALFLFVLGTEFAIDIFEIPVNSKWNYLGSYLFLGNMVICNELSYISMAIAFGLSFLLSIVAVAFIKRAFISASVGLKKSMKFVLIASLCIAIMMGTYQAYLGVTCLMLEALCLIMLLKNKNIKDIYIFLISAMSAGFGGFVLYEIIQKTCLKVYQVEMSDYHGANDISIHNIFRYLKRSVREALLPGFFENVIGENFKWNYFTGNVVLALIALLIIIFIIIVIQKLWNVNKIYMCLVGLLSVLTPLVANICTILAPKNIFSEQQTGPIAMILPCFIWLLAGFFLEEDNLVLRKIYLKKMVVGVASSILIWGSIYQVIVDQECMREGILGLESIGKGAIEMMFESECYDESLSIAIVGAPYDNALYFESGISEKANNYARTGGYTWSGGINDLWLWRGVFNYKIGYNFNFAESAYRDLLKDERVIEMPNYPNDGCVQIIDDVIVVKIADPKA